jgi:hypothetical protein
MDETAANTKMARLYGPAHQSTALCDEAAKPNTRAGGIAG